MLEIKNLSVSVEEKQIINDISLQFEVGKNYCLLGKNGSGKSTLSSFLMGSPEYQATTGSVSIDNQDLLDMNPEQRSACGLFLSFQHIPEIEGIRLSEYLRIIYNLHLKAKTPDMKDISPFIFKRFIQKHLESLHIDPEFLDRDLNVGFSGGEKRKIEILQMKLIGPKYIILDEIDSGLDLDAFRAVATLLKDLSSSENTLILITHYFTILDYIEVDEVYILKQGKIKDHGGKELIEQIKKEGFGTNK